jgi:hypothetical protein
MFFANIKRTFFSGENALAALRGDTGDVCRRPEREGMR